ncbi:PREDICTED: putative two-component response regulator ARR19 [Camelina sativa]|uniref:Two-component response regulator ARR19 n=1 Tax=Camelina sativa TaxID=90675 RepID=A0ABM0X5I9_CAMSA|nr:PREDICTED: putative two-component response regulator ARR19 [Camelina sativa]
MLVANRSKDEVDYTSEITSLLNQFPANTNVLVVDTNFTNLLNIKGIMRQQYDYQVTIETDAEKALAFLTSCKHDINIVIWDYHMPKIDGLQALKSIASKMDLPVMIMSDDNQTESVMKAIVHGACEYVLKPVQEDVIANLWQHIVRKKVMSKRNISPPVQSDLAQSDGSRQRKVDSKIVDQEQNIGKKEESGEKRPLITWNRELQRVQSDLLQINVFNQHNDYHKTRNQDSCEQNIGKKEERVETRPWMTWNKANQPFQFNPVQINGLAQQNYYSKTINQDKGEQSIERAAKKPCMRAEEKELVHTDDSNNGDSVEIIDKRVWKKTRKQRMTWTKDLHKKFLEAIEMNGGIEKANPKVLLDCLQGMKIQGLTRNNVASHLQVHTQKKKIKHRIYLEEKQIPKQTQIIGWSTEYVAAPSLQGPNNVHTGISQYVRNGPALNPIHQNQYQNGAVNPIQHNQYLNGAVNPIQQNQYQNGEVNLIQQKQYQNEIVNPIQQSQYQMGVVNPIQQKQYQNGAVNPMKQNQYQNGALNSIQQNDLNRAVNPIQQNNEYQKGYLAMNKNLFITNPSLPHVSYFDNQPRQPQQQQSSSQFNYLTSNEELGKASNIYALDPQLTYPSLSYM